MTRIEFELAYYDVAVQHVSPYATGDSLQFFQVQVPAELSLGFET